MAEEWVILVLNLHGFQVSVHFVLGHCSEWSDSPEQLGSFPYTSQGFQGLGDLTATYLLGGP